MSQDIGCPVVQARQELEVLNLHFGAFDPQFVFKLSDCRGFGAFDVSRRYGLFVVDLIRIVAIKLMAAARVGPDAGESDLFGSPLLQEKFTF